LEEDSITRKGINLTKRRRSGEEFREFILGEAQKIHEKIISLDFF
jgi:hypothetical protein